MPLSRSTGDVLGGLILDIGRPTCQLDWYPIFRDPDPSRFIGSFDRFSGLSDRFLYRPIFHDKDKSQSLPPLSLKTMEALISRNLKGPSLTTLRPNLAQYSDRPLAYRLLFQHNGGVRQTSTNFWWLLNCYSGAKYDPSIGYTAAIYPE